MTEARGLQRSLLEFMSERRLQGELVSAPGAENFMLHVQPGVDLSSGRIVGAEVIGRCVVGEAAAAAAGLRAIQPSFRLWFNVSARELNDPRWLERVAREGDSLQGLGAAITESDAMQNVPETLRVLTILKRAGLSIALDDFGSCYPLLAEPPPRPRK